MELQFHCIAGFLLLRSDVEVFSAVTPICMWKPPMVSKEYIRVGLNCFNLAVLVLQTY